MKSEGEGKMTRPDHGGWGYACAHGMFGESGLRNSSWCEIIIAAPLLQHW